MSITCIIVDDEQYARELIEKHISQIPDLTLTKSCSSAMEASSILQGREVDLMFLDIEMPVL